MLRNMNRSLSIVTANQADIPSLVQIYFNSFTTNFRKQAFPDTVSTRRWWEQKLAKEMKSSNALFLKAVDLEKSTDEEKIVAWAHWSFQKQQKNCSPPRNSWPGEADVELCEKHFGDLEKKHQHLMHGRQHWYLEYLATDPPHQGRGAGGMLIRHVLSVADAAGLETYLEAPSHAVPIYRKYGFEERSFVDVDVQEKDSVDVYRNWCMVRLAS